MRLPLAAAAAALAVISVAPPAPAQREFGFDNRKASGQPYLAPEETVKRMKVAPEFEVKLFAGEPLLANPIAFTLDEKGRVWAVECFEYPNRTPKGQRPRDRIVILEDTDGDGAADKRTVFAEGKDFPEPFDLASGIEVGHGGVFVGAPPYLWFIENKGDKPGKFEILLKGFGSQDTHETLNTFQWGPDGWLYGLHGVFTQSNVKGAQLDGPETRMNAAVWRYHPKAKKFEVFAEGTSNPWGMDWRNADGQFILCCCVIPHLFHIVPGGIYKRQSGPSYNAHAYGFINEICDHTFHKESGWAHAGLISLDAPHIPEKYRNSVIFGSIHGCSVKQNVLKPNGSTFTASRGDDFLVSGDKNFRPINMKWGPLGDIYLIDWHDQNPCHQAKPDSWDYERGRVYRIQLKGTQPKKAANLAARSLHELAQSVMTGEYPWERRTAARLLNEASYKGALREDGALILPREFEAMRASVVELARKDQPAASKFRAALLATAVRHTDQPGLDHHTDANVLAWWVRQDTTWTAAPNTAGKVAEKILGPLATQRSPAVRREVASAAVRMAGTQNVTGVLHELMWTPDDGDDPLIPHLVWVAYEKVLANAKDAALDAELEWFVEQCQPKPLKPDHIVIPSKTITDHVLPKVMRRLAATGKPEHLARCVAFLGKLSDEYVGTRRKALAGFALGLQGQTFAAPAGWAKLRAALLAAKDPATADLVTKLSVTFRDPQAFKRAAALAGNAKRPDAERIEAVRQIALLRDPDGVKVLLGVVKADGPDAVRAEAVRALASFADKDVPQVIVTNWKSLPPAVRAEAVNLLAGRREWAAALLSAMKEKVIDRAAVTDNAIIRIQGFKDRGLNALIEEAWGRTRPTPAELTAQIDKMRVHLQDGTGSFARGKKVFETQCAKCHKFDGAGADVGPALDGAGRDVEYLLANVLDPNRVIGAPYFIRQANLTDGQIVQGVLAEEDERTVTLRVEGGALKKIAKADLDGPVKVLEKSMMPEGLGSNMTVQDFRDLVRYVMADPFVIAWTQDGKPVAGGVAGPVPLAEPAKAGAPVVAEAKVTAAADLTTQLLVGAQHPYEIKLDGQTVGTGDGDRSFRPDRDSFPVRLAKGEHTLTLVLKPTSANRAVTVRFRDPDRKLRYPDAGEK